MHGAAVTDVLTYASVKMVVLLAYIAAVALIFNRIWKALHAGPLR